jgi:hypothetical protein
MEFQNPDNGFTETKSVPALWTLLFGGLYFLTCGLWAPAVIWLILATIFYTWLGGAGTILVIPMSLLFAFAAPGMVRANYLRRGWVEVDEHGRSELRKCPSCAELVKRDAMICRFCKTEL